MSLSISSFVPGIPPLIFCGTVLCHIEVTKSVYSSDVGNWIVAVVVGIGDMEKFPEGEETSGFSWKTRARLAEECACGGLEITMVNNRPQGPPPGSANASMSGGLFMGHE